MTRTIDEIRRERDAMQRRYDRYQGDMNEGGDGYNPHAGALRTLKAEYDAAMDAHSDAGYQAQLAAEDAEWTREVTIARRADWNAWVRSMGATLHPAQMVAHCQEVGYDMLLLKRQIQRHGL
jgi:hypothetical protein